jgi:hypothetical protein
MKSLSVEAEGIVLIEPHTTHVAVVTAGAIAARDRLDATNGPAIADVSSASSAAVAQANARLDPGAAGRHLDRDLVRCIAQAIDAKRSPQRTGVGRAGINQRSRFGGRRVA